MKLEQQVCSLELAKKLKELGFEQDSLWYWTFITPMGATRSFAIKEDSNWYLKRDRRFHDSYVSAYTVAELGEMLSETTYGFPLYDQGNKKWFSCLGKTITEADARAKMLIYLKENNLL